MCNSGAAESDFGKRVQAEVEKRLASELQRWAEMSQFTMRQATENIDRLNDELQSARLQLDRERDALQDERRSLIEQARKIWLEAIDDLAEQWRKSIRSHYLAELIEHNVQRSKPNEEIAEWLHSDLEAVERIAARRNTLRAPTYAKNLSEDLPHSPRLRYETVGRGGTIHYTDDRTSFGLWWEFAGGLALAIIDIPTEIAWEERTGIPLSDRDQTIRFIAEQVLRDQTTNGGSYYIGPNTLTLFAIQSI